MTSRFPTYGQLIYAGTLLTGFSGLVYQVVWQRYLTSIVGSDARSVALVVATFLAGLAAGYRFWGGLSERIASRRRLLRIYGLIEVGIGLYAAAFLLFYLDLLRYVGYHGPPWLVTDLVVTALALLPPTFLMGATIPLLVSVVPESAGEVNLCHAKIYGLNTLGACLGSFGATFWLLPRLGLAGAAWLAVAINLIVGVSFVLNRLDHAVKKSGTIPTLPNRFRVWTVYLYTFTTGAVTLSLEVLFVRVLNLTIGAGPHNFALVVGVFVFGLALGSLLIRDRLLAVRVLFRALLFVLAALAVVFYTVPYWPYWLANARAALTDVPVTYDIYMLLTAGLLLLLLLPFLVPLGFMLPLVYALLPKSSADYGKQCGWMYFYNTLGTACGAVGLSYLLLHELDLDRVFKIDVALLAALALLLFLQERRSWLAAGTGLATLAFLAGPGWDRSSHYLGLFSKPPALQEALFSGWFVVPPVQAEILFFKDGPDNTITAARHQDATGPSWSLVNNGRSEGDSTGDYSTMALLALLPYLHAPDRQGLDAAVVGLGTGITAGILGRAEEIRRVTVLEISRTVIRAAGHLSEPNLGVLTNPKIKVVPIDGFKYFARLNGELDIVVSEPSVPWVVGVENLFTPEYYRLVERALRDDGVFVQWFPLYTVDVTLFHTMLSNLDAVFPHLRLFRLSHGEMGILAAKSPLPATPSARRFAEREVAAVAAKMDLVDPDLLALAWIYDTASLRSLARSGDVGIHTLGRPSLAYASDRIRFFDRPIDWDAFLDRRLLRLARADAPFAATFHRLLARYPQGLACRARYYGEELFCMRYNRGVAAFALYASPPAGVSPAARLQAYDALRQEGAVAADPAFLHELTLERLEAGGSDGSSTSVVQSLVAAYAEDGLWEEARADLDLLLSHGSIEEAFHRRAIDDLARARQRLSRR